MASTGRAHPTRPPRTTPVGGPDPDLASGLGDPRRRAYFALCGLLLATLVPVCAWGLLTGGASSERGVSSAQRAQQMALAQWEALWSDLAAHGQDALRPELSDRSLRAAGDTVFMRYRNLWGEVDPAARRAMQMAALSGDPVRKLALLRPLASASDPLTRFRGLLEIARIQLRQGTAESAETAARQALAIPGIAPRIQSDAYFILGQIAWDGQSFDAAEAALTQAVAADPGFWDARQLRLLVLARQLGRPRQSVAKCLDRTRQMIQDLGALPALAQDRTQFRDIADRFAAQGESSNPAFALLSGLGYRWAGDVERAHASLAAAETARARLPAVCERLILTKAREWLDE